MKKYLFYTLLMVAIFNGYSQEYKKFRVGIGGGLGYFYNSGNSPMLSLVYIEPSFRITNNVVVGYKSEITLPFLEDVITSQSITSQYYVLNKPFRTFVGAGVGIFNFYDGSRSGLLCDCGTTTEKTKFGFSPRVGFDYNHLTIMIEYNWMPPFKQTTTSFYPFARPEITPLQSSISYINRNYFSAKVGITIGGGKKKPTKTE